MSEYSRLTPAARAKLLTQDPKRYTAIKAEHERAVARVQDLMKNAKTHAEYTSARAELERLTQVGGPPPSGDAA